MIDFDFAKEIYYRELDGKAALDAKLNTHLFILSLLAGAMYIVLKSGVSLRSGHEAVKAICGAAAILSYLVGMVYVLLAALPRSYQTIAPASELSLFHDQLVEYHNTCEGDVDVEFRQSMLPRIVEAASVAQFNNLTRSARYYNASLLLAASFVLTIAAGGARVYPIVRDCVVAVGGVHAREQVATTQANHPSASEAEATGPQEHDLEGK